jgi:hypothetical protein
MKIHLVFHFSLLKPYKESSILGRFQVLSRLIEIEGDEEFELLEILNSRIIRRNWSILFTSRDTTLVKGLGNLSPIFVMLQK